MNSFHFVKENWDSEPQKSFIKQRQGRRREPNYRSARSSLERTIKYRVIQNLYNLIKRYHLELNTEKIILHTRSHNLHEKNQIQKSQRGEEIKELNYRSAGSSMDRKGNSLRYDQWSSLIMIINKIMDGIDDCSGEVENCFRGWKSPQNISFDI